MGLSHNSHPFTNFTITRTTTGTTPAVEFTSIPLSSFALQVSQTGTVTAWTVILEGSLDGINFTTILTHTKVLPGDNIIMWTSAPMPCLYARIRVTTLTLGSGTNIVISALGIP